MNGESRGRYASLSPLSAPSDLKRLTLTAVTRKRVSYARMPKTDHPDGAETITQAVKWSLAVPSSRHQQEYPEGTNLNWAVLSGVGTT
jgi:hypothetical protein